MLDSSLAVQLKSLGRGENAIIRRGGALAVDVTDDDGAVAEPLRNRLTRRRKLLTGILMVLFGTAFAGGR
jgi:hypothetical protein